MGKAAREILDIDVDALVSELNRGVAAELNDAYRYTLLSKLVSGPRSPELSQLFGRMAQSEWSHLAQLVERILQLGGRPMDKPSLADAVTYVAPADTPSDPRAVGEIVRQSLDSERAAIRYWHSLFDKTKHADPVTASLASAALADEVEDEDNLERFLASEDACSA